MSSREYQVFLQHPLLNSSFLLCINLILLFLPQSLGELSYTDHSVYLGKNCSVPKMQKIKTKKKMISSPSTRTEETEDGEGHHLCRKSTLIYSLTQPTEEDRHCQRKSYPPLCLQHQRELSTKQRQIKDSQNSSSAIIMSGKIFYMYYTCLLLRHIFFFQFLYAIK